MASRRMFAITIVDSDAFIEMPLSSQALYFHLAMRADDDGFVNSPKKVQRMVGAADDDLKVLIAKRFILSFASGVIVIKHWRMQNQLRKDRYKPTLYQEELSTLFLNENGSYTDDAAAADRMTTTWQPDGNQLAPQYSEVKYSEVNNTYSLTGESDDFENVENAVENIGDDEEDNEYHQIRPVGGTLGQGLVNISPAQEEDLLNRMSIHEFNHYYNVITECIKKGYKYGKTHYQAILDMAAKDRKVR